MKIFLIPALILSLAAPTDAKEFNYSRVLMAGTGDLGNTFVRYLYSSETPCLVIQSLVPGGKGKVSAQQEICSIDGKSFYDGYTYVDFKSGKFENGKLFFDVGITPLKSASETSVLCEVIFKDELADHLSCSLEYPDEDTKHAKCRAENQIQPSMLKTITKM
ncbi:hypothetical protein ABQX22_20755 [Xanthomonas sp. WHRI 1810A]|uniref:hypothetical protein n=1 Tax=Xanthomonas sp. WHRI 1810A TaxID=3161565 RepID=UPI0032E915E3